MSEHTFYLSECASFDEDMLHLLKTTTSSLSSRRANIKRYRNILGQLCESYAFIDEDGVVLGHGLSTNIQPDKESCR